MRGALGFDPRQCDYGPATEAVQQILLDCESIDWFAPTDKHANEARGLFLRHNELGHAFAPELFPDYVDVRFRAGGWSEFMTWCTRVRNHSEGWDWKFSVLKPLSCAHAKAHGWSLDQQVAHEGNAGPRPGDLFFRYRDPEHSFVMWCGVMPKIAELESRRNEPVGNATEFYLRYAHDDAICCIQWQLAERSNDLSRNPFAPLLGCYRAGFYPFSLSRDSVVLFEFTTARLPRHRGTSGDT